MVLLFSIEGDFMERGRDGVAYAAGIEPLLSLWIRRRRTASLPP